MNFDDIFKDIRELQKKIKEDFFKDFGSFEIKTFNDIDSIKEKINEGSLSGNWEFKPIEKPGMNGFIIRGYFSPDLENKPDDTLHHLKQKVKEPREPLYDINIAEDYLTIYIELPGVNEENIKLNLDRNLNLEAEDFKADIDLSAWILDTSKMLKEYKNGILKLKIPKTELKEQSF
jgi:HSP20 family protein